MKKVGYARILAFVPSWSLVGLVLLLLTGCREVAPGVAPQEQRDTFLGVIGFFVFLGTLIYAGYKAFVELNMFYRGVNQAGDRIESRTRSIGFIIGILITALIIAVDTEQNPVSTSTILAIFPWYIFTCLGIMGGVAIGVASGVIARYRGTSGTGLMILVFAFLGGTGLYLSLYADGLRSNVLAAMISVQIGVLSFRMLFPAGVTTINN